MWQDPSMLFGALLAALSGVAFAMLGASYRFGAGRGVPAYRIAVGVGLMGAVFFGFRSSAAFWRLPAPVLLLGVAAGLTQYMTIRIVNRALSWGPLSPVWCSVSLAFIPVSIYAWLAFGEGLRGVHLAGIGAGILCVVLGSLRREGVSDHEAAGVRRLPYASALVGILVLNAVGSMALKYLSETGQPGGHGSLLDACRSEFFLLMFIVLGLLCALRSCAGIGRDAFTVRALLPVLMAAAAAVTGNLLMAAAVPLLPAAMVFTINSVTAILGVGTLSVLAFREPAGSAWWMMMGCGVLAVLLLNVV